MGLRALSRDRVAPEAQEVPLALQSCSRNALSVLSIFEAIPDLFGREGEVVLPHCPNNDVRDGCFSLKSNPPENPMKGETLNRERNLNIPGKPGLVEGKGMK